MAMDVSPLLCDLQQTQADKAHDFGTDLNVARVESFRAEVDATLMAAVRPSRGIRNATASDSKKGRTMDSDRINGEGNDLKGQIKEGLGNITGDSKLKAEGAEDQIAGMAQRTFGQARDTLRDAAENVSSQAGTVGEWLDDTIHEKPLYALLAAGAIGYVLSLLIHRR